MVMYWSQIAKVQIPALLFSSCVTQGKLLNLSGPQFPHLANGNANCTNLNRTLAYNVLLCRHLANALHAAFPTASRLLFFLPQEVVGDWGRGFWTYSLILKG